MKCNICGGIDEHRYIESAWGLTAGPCPKTNIIFPMQELYERAAKSSDGGAHFNDIATGYTAVIYPPKK